MRRKIEFGVKEKKNGFRKKKGEMEKSAKYICWNVAGIRKKVEDAGKSRGVE